MCPILLLAQFWHHFNVLMMVSPIQFGDSLLPTGPAEGDIVLQKKIKTCFPAACPQSLLAKQSSQYKKPRHYPAE